MVNRTDLFLNTIHEKFPRVGKVLKNPHVDYVLPTHLMYDGPNVIDYQERRIEAFSWIYVLKSTVFRPRHFVSVSFLCGLAFLFGWFSCPDGNGMSARSNTCIPLPSTTSALTLASLAAFLVVALFSRTMDRYSNINSKNGAILGISLKVSAVLHNYVRPDLVAPAHAEVNRLLQAAQRILLLNCNDLFDYSELVQEGLLTPAEEKAINEDRGRYYHSTIVYTWIIAIIRNIKVAGYFEVRQMDLLIDMVWAILGNAASLVTGCWSPLPYAYFHMFTFTVRVFLIQVFFVSSGLIGDAIYTGRYGQMFTGYMTLIMNYLVYRGILSYWMMMRNPMGEDPNDIAKGFSIRGLKFGLLSYQNNSTSQWPPADLDPDATWWSPRVAEVDVPEKNRPGTENVVIIQCG